LPYHHQKKHKEIAMIKSLTRLLFILFIIQTILTFPATGSGISGKDINIQGSTVAGTGNTTLAAAERAIRGQATY